MKKHFVFPLLILFSSFPIPSSHGFEPTWENSAISSAINALPENQQGDEASSKDLTTLIPILPGVLLTQANAPRSNPVTSVGSDRGRDGITLQSIMPQAIPTEVLLEPMRTPAQTAAYSTADQDLKARPSINDEVDSMIGTQPGGSALFSKVRAENASAGSSTLSTSIRNQVQNGSDSNFEWAPYGYAWEGPAFCYRNLYFEQPNLERYGSGYGHVLTPTLSAAHFVTSVCTLPIKAVCNPPWNCDCTLGHHRPGNCAPHQRFRQHKVNRTSGLVASSQATVSIDESSDFFIASDAFERDEAPVRVSITDIETNDFSAASSDTSASESQ